MMMITFANNSIKEVRGQKTEWFLNGKYGIWFLNLTQTEQQVPSVAFQMSPQLLEGLWLGGTKPGPPASTEDLTIAQLTFPKLLTKSLGGRALSNRVRKPKIDTFPGLYKALTDPCMDKPSCLHIGYWSAFQTVWTGSPRKWSGSVLQKYALLAFTSFSPAFCPLPSEQSKHKLRPTSLLISL